MNLHTVTVHVNYAAWLLFLSQPLLVGSLLLNLYSSLMAASIAAACMGILVTSSGHGTLATACGALMKV